MVCKIISNFEQVDFKIVLDYLNSKGEFLFIENILYFKTLNSNIDKRFFKKIKKIFLNNVFIKEIKLEDKDSLTEDNYLSYWIKQGIEQDIKYEIETNNQKQLKEMYNNINTFSLLIDNFSKQQGGEENIGE